MPAISIIVPAYNSERYLERCIQSIQTQTFSDIEIIVVDDGSSDNTLEIIQRMSKSDSRIKTVHKPNGGVSSARNMGIEHSTGEFIMFVDADDWLDPNAVEVTYADIVNNSADISMFTANEVYDDGLVKTINYPLLYRFKDKLLSSEQIQQNILPLFLHSTCLNSVWNKMYRADMLKGNNLTFDENTGYGEDYIFNVCAFQLAGRFRFIDHPLYNYYQRKGSATSSFNNKQLDELGTMYSARLGLYEKYFAPNNELLKQVNSFTLCEYLRYLTNIFRYGAQESFMDKYHISKNSIHHHIFARLLRIKKPYFSNKSARYAYFFAKHGFTLGLTVFLSIYFFIKNRRA